MVRKRKTEFNKLGVFLFLAFSLVALSFSGKLLQRQSLVGKASAPTCNNFVAIWVSSNGTNFSSDIQLPAGAPTKYYVKTYLNGQPCSSNFDVSSQRCDGNGNNCQAWQTTLNWGTYRPNQYGILRADLDDPWPGNLLIKMKLRPAGRTDIQWSNQIQIRFTSIATYTQVSENMQNYIKMVPGWTYIYNSINNKSGGQMGITRMQIEQQITKCGVNMFPWRFTKSSNYVYWGPYRDQQNNGQRDLRWFIVDPGFNYTPLPSYNNYIWGLGDSNYTRWSDDSGVMDPIRDIQFNSIINSHTYRTSADAGGVPSYNLSLKNISYFPYISYLKGKVSGIVQAGPLTNCQLTGGTGTSSWKIRIDKDNVSINNGPGLYNYSGEAIRVDYYEGKYPLETGWLLRESWYYVKDTGLVKIVSKLFNNYGGINTLLCKDDSDCWDDTIQNPYYVVTLKQLFQNPTLNVSVSSDGTNFYTAINTTQAQGYWLKVNPPYTGYLESGGGNPKRWLWVENGLARVSNPGGIYNYQSTFRIWVPNELDPGETIGPNPVWLPWSNTTTVNVTGPGDATCTSSTWYTGYNFSGNNWCPVNNQLCATNWISNPQIPVSCGTQRLKNYGTYCTKTDGTRSFTGTSSCVN